MAIVRTLREAGHVAYFAGGCVRDELLGLVPSDYDVATDAMPDRIASLFRRTAAVGASFGVMLVKEGASVIEVATFRADGTYADRRRPDSVRFSTPLEDAQRRDFTVNALFLDPVDLSADASGRVIDLVGGVEDLGCRVIRAVGDPKHRLAEDHLRALRAVRLAAKLGFTIDPHTAAAISRHATDLRGVSRERIGDEVRLMLAHPTRAVATDLLQSLGLSEAVLETPGGPSPGATRRLALLGQAAPLGLSLAAWALDLGTKPQPSSISVVCRAWRKALCLSNDEHTAMKSVLSLLDQLSRAWPAAGVAARKRLAVHPHAPDALTLLHAQAPSKAQLVQGQISALEADGVGLKPKPLLTGDDLIAAGWTPGPQFRLAIDRVYDSQLEGEIHEMSEALELAARYRV